MKMHINDALMRLIVYGEESHYDLEVIRRINHSFATEEWFHRINCMCIYYFKWRIIQMVHFFRHTLNNFHTFLL